MPRNVAPQRSKFQFTCAVSLLSGVPSSNVRMLKRSNSTGSWVQRRELRRARHAGHIRLVEVRGEREVEAAGARHRTAQFRTTSTPCVCVSTPLMKKRPPPDAEVKPWVARYAAHRRRRQVLRQHDPVVDVDAIGVDRDVDLTEAQHRADGVVDRVLGVELLGAERHRDRVGRRERGDVETASRR